MDPEMIRIAMMWGGTHREGDREGFGRFGFGLPSASVSIAREYTVYSWTGDGEGIKAVTFNVDSLTEGHYRDEGGRTSVPSAVAADLPAWVNEYIQGSFPGGLPVSGTVVLLKKMDGLDWKTAKVLKEKLTDHIGMVYRKLLKQTGISVHGSMVEPVDPLFLDQTARFYNGDAEELPPAVIEVAAPETGESLGVVKVRYSYLPPAAFSHRYGPDRALSTARRKIMDANNGLIVLRNGRQIDVVRTFPKGGAWLGSLQNNDTFFKVEVDFPATLDEYASVTTSKQQIVFKDLLWDILEKAGVPRMQKDRRAAINRELAELRKAQGKEGNEPRASEQVMTDVRKFKSRRSQAVPAEREAEAEQNKRQHVRERAEAENLPPEIVEQQLELDTKTKRYVVEQEILPGAPFYRVIPRGGQIVLLINKGHRFYTEVYAAEDASPQVRAALEIMLFVMGEAELDASPDRRRFYESERSEWSQVLNTALDRLHELDAADTEPLSDEEEAGSVVALVG
jgi:hypothetical protein